jgi:thiosulfate/3-mercaptopyruvate sulfurtransferase
MTEARHSTLIEPLELAECLGDPDLVVLDCRHDLARPNWGSQAYADSHVPGALHAHVDRDLAGPATPRSGRHPLPSLAAFVATASRWGVDEHVQVVAYDQSSGAWAARAWWLLRRAGHAGVAVLNGGFAAWQSAGLPVATDAPRRHRRRFVARTSLVRALTTAEVTSGLSSGAIRLVDARSAERFAGRCETVDPVAGHVPGAVNHPYEWNLDPSGGFLPREELHRRWAATTGGLPPERIVAMCGSGVTACHNLLALELAGLHGAALYAGSWSEWIRDPSRAVARG